MSEENNNLHLSEQIDDGEDDELSMVDVLNEQDRLQADADAVLGGSDANHCTFPQGRIKRQALYACATCTPEGNAGICLACSYACHEGHELYELYTKRYFTCDCGNDKFGGKECKLYKEAKGLNADNYYNQNFKGLYCSCARPYPDPEDSVEDDMIQCIMCEDWYHGRHLKATAPEDFHEMICSGCMSKYAFLWAYNTSRLGNPSDYAADDTGEVIDVCSHPDRSNSDSAVRSTEVGDTTKDTKCTESHTETNTLSTEPPTEVDQADKLIPVSPSEQADSPDGSRKREAADTIGADLQVPSPKKVKLEAVQKQEEISQAIEDTLDSQTKEETMDSSTKEETVDSQATQENDDKSCILKSLQKCVTDFTDSAAFWPEGWRSKLCQCQDCLQMYREKGIEFLTDESDTVRAYEEKGRDSTTNMSDEDSTATALAGMNRVQQIEVVRGFMDLKTELNGFLHGFAQNGKVVTETDIREFFQRMDQRRKERMPVSQYNCR